MGDTAEFEKLNTLEARLAAALDRIATGLGERLAQAPLEDPGLSAASFDDLLMRAETAEARVATLEAQIAGLVDPAAAEAAAQEAAATIAAQEEARDIAEELQAAAGHHPEERAMTLRAEIKELQVINDRLIKNINRLRGENATDPGVLNKTLVVELDALRAQRASEAAELERILADLDPAHAGGDAHA